MSQFLADGFLPDGPLRELLGFYSRVGAETSSRCLSTDADDDPLCNRLAVRSIDLNAAGLRYLMGTQKLTQVQAQELFNSLSRRDYTERLAAGTLQQVPLEKALTELVRGIMAP